MAVGCVQSRCEKPLGAGLALGSAVVGVALYALGRYQPRHLWAHKAALGAAGISALATAYWVFAPGADAKELAAGKAQLQLMGQAKVLKDIQSWLGDNTIVWPDTDPEFAELAERLLTKRKGCILQLQAFDMPGEDQPVVIDQPGYHRPLLEAYAVALALGNLTLHRLSSKHGGDETAIRTYLATSREEAPERTHLLAVSESYRHLRCGLHVKSNLVYANQEWYRRAHANPFYAKNSTAWQDRQNFNEFCARFKAVRPLALDSTLYPERKGEISLFWQPWFRPDTADRRYEFSHHPCVPPADFPKLT